MKLYIDSGTHVETDVSSRIREIESNVESLDIVFYEGDVSNFSKSAIQGNLLLLPIAPLLAVAVFFQIYVITEALGRGLSSVKATSAGRDQDIVDGLKEHYGIGSVEVDMGLTRFVHENRTLFGAVNWGMGGLIVVSVFPFRSVVAGVAEALVYIMIAGYLILLTLLALVHERRNRHFASTIIEHSEKYDEACLVAGETHHAGLLPRGDTDARTSRTNNAVQPPLAAWSVKDGLKTVANRGSIDATRGHR